MAGRSAMQLLQQGFKCVESSHAFRMGLEPVPDTVMWLSGETPPTNRGAAT